MYRVAGRAGNGRLQTTSQVTSSVAVAFSICANAFRCGETNFGSSRLLNVWTTSADVSSWPSWNFTPRRSGAT